MNLTEERILHDEVILETIYYHLSPRRKRDWTSSLQKQPWPEPLDDLTFASRVRNRLFHLALTDENWGLLVNAKGKEREAIARVANLYGRLVNGDRPADKEWTEVQLYVAGVMGTFHPPKSWRLYFWWVVMAAAAGFAFWRSFPIVKGDALLAALVVWWAYKKVQVPLRTSRLGVAAAFSSMCAFTYGSIHPYCEVDLGEKSDYTTSEEWEARTLAEMAEASLAGSIESLQKTGMEPNEEALAQLKQEYWNWLSEAVLQLLRDLRPA